MPLLKNLVKNVLFIVLLAYLLKVKVPPDHLCANDPVFIITKTLVSCLHSTLLFISERTPFWIYIPTLRKLLDATVVPDHIKINIIQPHNKKFTIEHIMPKELRNVKSRKTMFYYHGGGMAAGGPRSYPISYLKRQKDVQIFGIDYRLAPETPFPGAIDDCVEATRFILSLSERYNIGEFSIYGESAGGNLVLSTMMSIDFEKEFGRKPVTAHAAIPMGQMMRFDTPSYSSPDNHFELSRKLMTEFWLMYSGVSDNNIRNRELLQRNLHWEKQIRDDEDFLERTNPERWLPPKYAKDYKGVKPNKHDFGNDFPKKLGKLLRNKLFSPGCASDDDLLKLCRNAKNVVVSVAEYDVLRDDGIMIAERMKFVGCKNVELVVYEKVGHLFFFESEKNTNLPVGFKVYDELADESIDLTKFE